MEPTIHVDNKAGLTWGGKHYPAGMTDLPISVAVASFRCTEEEGRAVVEAAEKAAKKAATPRRKPRAKKALETKQESTKG